MTIDLHSLTRLEAGAIRSVGRAPREHSDLVYDKGLSFQFILSFEMLIALIAVTAQTRL